MRVGELPEEGVPQGWRTGATSAALAGLIPELPCPQCGALLTVPHREELFTCPWCGSTLRPGEGARIYRLVERPRLGRAAAEQAVRAWLAGPELPRDADTAARIAVGPLERFPFLRVRGQGADRVVPLAPLTLPDVLELPAVPADLAPATASIPVGAEAPSRVVPVDDELLRRHLGELSGEAGLRELFVEERAYFPVHYSYQAERFTAVVDAGAGRVRAARHPARREVVGERLLAPPVALLLFVEAVLVPTLPLKVAAILVTAAALFPLTRWTVTRHG